LKAQKIVAVGKTVVCTKCKEVATTYCACGTFLCAMHTASHRCLLQLQATYSRAILEAMR
jgi:hypothetical protein